jgi:hypothetical protein
MDGSPQGSATRVARDVAFFKSMPPATATEGEVNAWLQSQYAGNYQASIHLRGQELRRMSEGNLFKYFEALGLHHGDAKASARDIVTARCYKKLEEPNFSEQEEKEYEKVSRSILS